MTSVWTGASFSRCWVPVPVTTTSCKLSERHISCCASTDKTAHKDSSFTVSNRFMSKKLSATLTPERAYLLYLLAGLLTFPSLPYLPDFRVSGVIQAAPFYGGLQLQEQSRALTGFPCIVAATATRLPFLGAKIRKKSEWWIGKSEKFATACKKTCIMHGEWWIFCNFAAWFWKESPVKVHLAVLNWELECESPTVPQQWTPLWPWSRKAIEYLLEKALWGGGKSEDQPLSE